MGRMMSLTRELAQAVKAAARLYGLVNYTLQKALVYCLHEADCDFEDIVSKRKVAEAIPGTRRLATDASLRVA